VLPVFLQLWMFASPVAYPLTAIPERWRNLYVLANPVAGVLDGFRQTLAEGRFPDLGPLLLSTVMALVIAWLGYSLFKRIEQGFADAI